MNDRDPIAEQEEAARVFEERMGRKSTDPAPPAVLHMKLRPDGEIEIEQTPTMVFGRFPGGTDPQAALREVFDTMFPGSIEVPNTGYARKSKYPDAIEADVIEDDSNHWSSWKGQDDGPEREPCLSDAAFERLNSESISVSG